jgi:hypothetical protein
MAKQYRKIRRYGMEYEEAFLAAISAAPNITAACMATNMPASYVYKQRMTNPDFKERFDEAWALGLIACEDKAQEFAFKGIKRGVYYKGELIAEEYEPSERLVEFYLKANKPDKYRENGMTFNMGNNSLVQVLSGMPRSEAIEAPAEQKALIDGTAETRPADAD